jgi:hypothetical protein
MGETATRAVNIYSNGVVHCSVCAPADMSREEVERAVNAQNPTGLDTGWKVSDEPFRTGEANPHLAGDCGQHWLMVC